MDRRQLLLGTGIVATGLTTSSAAAAAPGDWDWVRREFQTDPELINFAHFYLVSHPRPVRNEIDRIRRSLDANSHNIEFPGYHRTADAVGGYIGGNAEDIALVQSTTTGLGLVYNGLKVRPDQELLIHDQDHFVHQESVQLAAQRTGAQVRLNSMFADSGKATADEIVSRVRAAITPRTRTVGVTWVQSSTGVKVPVRAIADVVAEANRGRAEQDRCLLIVDGVHGLAAVDDDAAKLGADVFVAGTHKWLFAPRGTGIIWVKPDAIQHFAPTVPSFDRRSPTSSLGPGGFVAYEHLFAVPAAVEFHRKLGRTRVAGRITELSTRVRDGLASMRGIKLWTPRDPALSAGVTCFDVDGSTGQQVVEHLAKKRIQITTASYRIPYARIGTSILNTPEQVDKALRGIAELTR